MRAKNAFRPKLIALLGAMALVAHFGSKTGAEAPSVISRAVEVETVLFSGEDIDLKGVLYKPRGSGAHPSVIALHGCGGLYDRNGALNARHADWADRLAQQGFLVLFPDSFGSRGVGPQCKTQDRVARPARERLADALAARAYLQSRLDVKADALSLLGWSNGGSTVLYAVSPDRRPSDGRPDFAKAVAFYPGCRLLAGGDWHSRLPLLILIGEADDWTPAQPCADLAESAQQSGEPVSLVTYPDAYHDFDHPKLAVHVTSDLAYTADGRGAAHTGTDPAARADAIRRVPAFLAR